MNEPTERELERLSALMDGEIGDAELEQALEQLLSSDEAQQRWANWHQISDGLHERTLDELPAQFHRDVAKNIASEPVYMIKRRRTHHLPSWLPVKQIAGMAVAASVTAVAILGFQQLHGPQDGATMVAAAQGQQDEGVGLRPVTRLQLVAGDFPLEPIAEATPELEAYLVNHQHLGGASSPVVSPYIRFVGHQAGTP